MGGKRGNPGCYPRHLPKPKGKGYYQSEGSGFLRPISNRVQDVRQGQVPREEADFTHGFGTNHPQDLKHLGDLEDPKPIRSARPQIKNPLSKQDLCISDQEIALSIREGRPPRSGH